MKKIIYTRPDGGLSVVHPAPQARLEGESEDGFLQRVLAKDVPSDAINVQIVEEEIVPADRTFRNAWEADGSKISVNMPKARELHRAKFRLLRKPKLEALDLAYMRADELGDTAAKAQVVSQKQALRDVTELPELEKASTPEELKAIIPEILK